MTLTILCPHPPANPMLLKGSKIPEWMVTVAAEDLYLCTPPHSSMITPCPWCLSRSCSMCGEVTCATAWAAALAGAPLDTADVSADAAALELPCNRYDPLYLLMHIIITLSPCARNSTHRLCRIGNKPVNVTTGCDSMMGMCSRLQRRWPGPLRQRRCCRSAGPA